MNGANERSRVLRFELVVALVSLLWSGIGFAASGGIPGPPPGPPPPPPPPPPPCIATAFITSTVPRVFTCTVHNSGVTLHGITIDIRDRSGNSIETVSLSTPPGTAQFLPTLGADAADCVVTTSEGTTDALHDLVVLLQANDGSSGAGEGETEGKILSECAPSNGPAE